MKMSVQCRTCSANIYNPNVNNIFEHPGDGILDKIKAVTGILLIDNAGMPRHICAYCLLDLNNATAFRERCIDTQNLLCERSMSNLHNKIISSVQIYNDPTLLNINESNCMDIFSGIIDKYADNSTNTNENAAEGTNTHNEAASRIHSPTQEGKTFIQQEKLYNISRKTAANVSTSQMISKKKMPYSHSNLCSKSTLLSQENTIKNKKWLTITKEKVKPINRRLRQKGYVCDQCGKHFNDRSNLKLHLIRHSGLKPFECPECDHKDFTKHLLNLHIRLKHRGEKPYACKYCDERFAGSTNRCRHEKTHNPQGNIKTRLYPCELCPKSFYTNGQLKMHNVVHTGERLHCCVICNVRFTRKTNLQTHYRSKMHQKNTRL